MPTRLGDHVLGDSHHGGAVHGPKLIDGARELLGGDVVHAHG